MKKPMTSEGYKFYLTASILALAALFAYGRLAPLLWKTWIDGDYSHGLFIPFISMYMAWEGRDRTIGVVIKPNYPLGLSIISLSAIMLIASEVGSIVAIQQYSLLVLVPGIIILLWGTAHLKIFSLPVAYLVLMVPILDPFLEHIHWPLQIMTSVTASSFLRLLDIPVLRSVQIIEMPNVTLDVAEECSGLQFLISMIAIGIPLAHLTQKFLWQKIVLMVSAIFIGLISNWVRVVFVALWTYYTGEFSHGPIHTFKGMLVSVVGFGILFAEVKLLNPADNNRVESGAIQKVRDPVSSYRFKSGGIWMASGFLLAVGVFLSFYSPSPVPLKRPLTEFTYTPSGFPDWKHIEKYMQPLSLPFADSEITMEYVNKSGPGVNVYIGYLESQNQNKELINDSLNRFQQGAKEVRLSLPDGSRLHSNRVVVRYGSERYLVQFWYNINGRPVANKYIAKLYTIMDGIFRGRTNGAVIMVFSRIWDDGNIEAVETAQKDFLKEFYPAVNRELSFIGS